jgi:Secretion system C-terminal sorting domain
LITRYPNEVCNPTLPPNGSQTLATITGRYPAGATAGYLQADVPGFSAFYIHGGASVIPVEMTSIKAFSEGNVNKIEWVTASEKSLKEFVVERSIDNKQWISIGSTAPKGGSKEAFYSLTDNQPLLLGYYRIRTVELNGSYEVSKIVSVKRFDSKKLAVLNVSPIPTSEGVTIDFSVNKETTITLILTNIVGQILKTETIKATEGTNNAVLSLNNLPNGTYLLNISDGETTTLKRVVKQ